MREIKFRYWEKINQEMIYNIDVFAFAGMFGDKAKDRFETMQFTGLKDKNGKEIYEGDMVFNYRFGSIQEVMRDKTYDCGPYLCSGFCLEIYDEEDIEIKGNIYENPDLLDNK